MSETPAPPEKKRDPKAPFGYNDDGSVKAPHGLKKDGTPYLRDPSRYKKRAEQARGDAAPNRAQRVYELLSIPVGVTAATAQATRSRALLADAVVVGNAAPKLATAVAQVADENERFAEVVDRLTSAGPYAALIGTLVPLAAQIAANHNERLGEALRGAGVAASVDDILKSAQSEVPEAAPESTESA